MKSNVVEAEALNNKLINFAACATKIDQISSAFNSLLSITKDQTSAYAVQEEALFKTKFNYSIVKILIKTIEGQDVIHP